MDGMDGGRNTGCCFLRRLYSPTSVGQERGKPAVGGAEACDHCQRS